MSSVHLLELWDDGLEYGCKFIGIFFGWSICTVMNKKINLNCFSCHLFFLFIQVSSVKTQLSHLQVTPVIEK